MANDERVKWLDPELVERAGLTRKQRDALELWDPASRTSGGYRTVGMILGVSYETARDHIKAGLRKIEIAMREPAE